LPQEAQKTQKYGPFVPLVLFVADKNDLVYVHSGGICTRTAVQVTKNGITGSTGLFF
jgi:hypothetical protein